MNLIITVGALICIFIWWHEWQKGAAKENIEFVLLKDAEFDKALDGAIAKSDFDGDDAFAQCVKAIQTRVSLEKQTPIDSCPSDFQEAFLRYLGAWNSYGTAISSRPHVEGNVEMFMKNFFRGMDFDFGGPERDQKEVTDWKARLLQSQSELDKCQTELEAIAVRYGAKLPGAK